MGWVEGTRVESLSYESVCIHLNVVSLIDIIVVVLLHIGEDLFSLLRVCKLSAIQATKPW